MLSKAKMHFQAAELLYRQGFYRDAVSRAYYAAFSAMQVCVGEPSRGRWEHPGLRGAFIRELTARDMPIDACRELRKRLRYLLDARELADYRVESIDEGTALDALAIAREVLRIVEDHTT